MNAKHTLAKILAVVSAMALASGYVAYRATGKLPWELHAAEGAGTVTPAPRPAVTQTPTQVPRTMILPSSKSYTGSTTIENAPVTIPASAAPAAVERPADDDHARIEIGRAGGAEQLAAVPGAGASGKSGIPNDHVKFEVWRFSAGANYGIRYGTNRLRLEIAWRSSSL